MADQNKRYLFVFMALFFVPLMLILLLNLALGARALGGSEVVRQASAWQQQTRGTTYAPPVTNSRAFKSLRLADRLGEINTVVLGASSLMGVTEAMFAAPMRLYNFTLTANATASITAEAEFLEQYHAGRVKNLLIGLDWAIGVLYLPVEVPVMNLAPAAQLAAYSASAVPLQARLADALSSPRVLMLGDALRGVLKSDQPVTAFRNTFFASAGAEYHCSDGTPARDFDVVKRGTCLGFRHDGSWTFAGEQHLSAARARILAQAAAAPSSQFSKAVCSAQGEPNAQVLARLGALARRMNDQGGHAVFIIPPLIPGMEAEMLRAAPSGACLQRTRAALDAWARAYGVTIIDAAAAETFGCTAGEFLDENHAWPACHSRVLQRYWQDRARGVIVPGLYRPGT